MEGAGLARVLRLLVWQSSLRSDKGYAKLRIVGFWNKTKMMYFPGGFPPYVRQEKPMQDLSSHLYTVPASVIIIHKNKEYAANRPRPASPEAISVLFQTARVVELEAQLALAKEKKANAISARNDLGEIQRAALSIALPGRVSSPHQSRSDPLLRGGCREYTPRATWAGWDILKDAGSPLTKELAELYANGLRRVATAELIGVRGILAAAGAQLS